MRNMKRLLCLLCTAAMLCGMLCVPAAGLSPAVCNGCDKVLTIAALQSAMGHSYVDGVCTVCGAAEPVQQTEPPETDPPETEPGEWDGGIGSAILSGLLPALVFGCALMFGYMMAKRTKKK